MCELINTSMLSCFTRDRLYLYHSGFVTEGAVVLREKLWSKTSKLYQLRGKADVQYSGKAQRAPIQEKKNIIVQCYSIFTSSTLYFLTNIPIINERVSIYSLVSAKKITKGQPDTVKCAKSLKSQGVISEDVVFDVWWDVLTEMWRTLRRWNNRCKWKQWAL